MHLMIYQEKELLNDSERSLSCYSFTVKGKMATAKRSHVFCFFFCFCLFLFFVLFCFLFPFLSSPTIILSLHFYKL